MEDIEQNEPNLLKDIGSDVTFMIFSFITESGLLAINRISPKHFEPLVNLVIRSRMETFLMNLQDPKERREAIDNAVKNTSDFFDSEDTFCDKDKVFDGYDFYEHEDIDDVQYFNEHEDIDYAQDFSEHEDIDDAQDFNEQEQIDDAQDFMDEDDEEDWDGEDQIPQEEKQQDKKKTDPTAVQFMKASMLLQ
jgi:hypothetical protein